MKKKLLFPLILFTVLQVNKAQQIGDGWAPVINDFTAILNSGVYSAPDPIGSTPVGSWQHLFVIRHPNANNNYQFQLSSSLWQDDRLFFRKLSYHDRSSGNQPWYELATRGSNTFNGVQIFNSRIGIGTNNPLNGLHVFQNNDFNNGSIRFGHSGAYDGTLSFGFNEATQIDALKLSYFPHNDINGKVDLMTIGVNGQVGIGTTDPGEATLKVFRDVRPMIEITDNYTQLQIGIAKNTWDWAPYSQPGDIVYRSKGPQHGLIFHMPDDNNDGLSYIRFGDNTHPNTVNITNKGFVGIGTFTPEFKLDVLGTIRAWGLKINNKKTADFVFAKDYKLPSLSEVETFVNKNNHLPGVASASDMEKNGVEIGEFQITLLQKIEELTLYSIQLKKENETQAKANADLQEQLLDMKKELDLIKKQMK